jgi:hypothetical protein
MKDFERMIEMIKEAYIKVMGREKWDSLTDKEKHDAIMILAKDLDKAISK